MLLLNLICSGVFNANVLTEGENPLFKYALYFLAYVLADPANKVLFKSCILERGT